MQRYERIGYGRVALATWARFRKVPDSHGLIPTAGGQCFAVGAKREPDDVDRVTLEKARRGHRTSPRPQSLITSSVPDARSVPCGSPRRVNTSSALISTVSSRTIRIDAQSRVDLRERVAVDALVEEKCLPGEKLAPHLGAALRLLRRAACHQLGQRDDSSVLGLVALPHCLTLCEQRDRRRQPTAAR